MVNSSLRAVAVCSGADGSDGLEEGVGGHCCPLAGRGLRAGLTIPRFCPGPPAQGAFAADCRRKRNPRCLPAQRGHRAAGRLGLTGSAGLAEAATALAATLTVAACGAYVLGCGEVGSKVALAVDFTTADPYLHAEHTYLGVGLYE